MAISDAQFSSLVDLYESEMISLLRNIGKDCRLIFPATLSNVDEDVTDPARGGNKKPIYKGDEPLQEENRETQIIRAFLKHNPNDYENFGVKIEHAQDIVRVKTLVEYTPDLRKAEFLVPDINVEGWFNNRYTLIRDPVPRGLARNRFCVTFWKRA